MRSVGPPSLMVVASDARFHSETLAPVLYKFDCDGISFQNPRHYHRQEWRPRSNRKNRDSLPKGRASSYRRKGDIVSRQSASATTDQGNKVEYFGVNFIDTYFRQGLLPYSASNLPHW